VNVAADHPIPSASQLAMAENTHAHITEVNARTCPRSPTPASWPPSSCRLSTPPP